MKVEDMLVICADDDPDDRELFCETITRIDERYKILHAGNGIEVLELLEKLKQEGRLPCLIIMDLQMPKMNGEAALQQIRADHYANNIPIVLLTGSPEQFPSLAKQYRVNVVTKPSGIQEIHTMLKRLLPYCD